MDVTVEWDDSAWSLIGGYRMRWSATIDHLDWSVKEPVGKHSFRGVSGNPLGFRRGPRGGLYITYPEREIRIRPSWLRS